MKFFAINCSIGGWPFRHVPRHSAAELREDVLKGVIRRKAGLGDMHFSVFFIHGNHPFRWFLQCRAFCGGLSQRLLWRRTS